MILMTQIFALPPITYPSAATNFWNWELFLISEFRNVFENKLQSLFKSLLDKSLNKCFKSDLFFYYLKQLRPVLI